MSKDTKKETAKVAKVPVAKVRNYVVTLESLKDQANTLQSEVSEIAARIESARQNMLIPFLADLTMGNRIGVVSDVRTFLVNAGFKSIETLGPDSAMLSLETCLGYQKKVSTWMNGGTTKAKLPTSMTAIVSGASKVKDNLTVKGAPSADFLKAANGPSGKFRKAISDGTWGKKDESRGNNNATTTTGKPKATGGKNSESDSKLPTNTMVALWIQSQVSIDELLTFRNDVTARIALIRKEGKKAKVA